MPLTPKIGTLAAGVVAALTAAALAQGQAPAGRNAQAPATTLVVSGQLDWLEESDLSTKREGVIKALEPKVGMRVESGQVIGYLHDEIAKLGVTKQKLVADSVGPLAEAKAKRQLAMTNLARLQRLERMKTGFVSQDEMDKAIAEVNVADAQIQMAQEKMAVDKAEYDLAVQALEDHKLVAPFTGTVIERHMNPGESVRANEAVLKIGKTDNYRFIGWAPLESALQARVGDIVQFRPVVDGSDLPVEHRVYEGKVTAISPELSTTGKTETYILAEIQNPPQPQQPELELRQGLKGEITIFLNGAAPRVAANQPAAAPERVGANERAR